jgi:hypothetical protein
MDDDMRLYPYRCSFFYGTDGPKNLPWKKGELAISTKHKSLSSAQVDIAAGLQRPEIGRIVATGPDLNLAWYREETS